MYILALFVATIYFIKLGYNSIWMPNEALTADGVRYALQEGKILIPYFNGEPFLHKPPMSQWISLLGVFLFGFNEFGIRFFYAVLGLSMGILTYLLAREFTDKKTSLLAGIIMISSFQFIANARYATPEVPFSFFILLTIYLWYKGYKYKKKHLILLAFVSSSFAVLTKWPPGFIIPAGIIFLYLLWKDRKELLNPIYYLGTLLVLILSGWWFLYTYMNEKEKFLEMIYFENIKRLYGIQEDPFYFHLLNIPVSFLPYSFIVYAGTFWWFKKRVKSIDFFALWFLLMLVVFSIVKMKLPTYMMPAYPAMSIITAEFLTKSEWKRTKFLMSLFLFIILLVATGVLAYLSTFEILPFILPILLAFIFLYFNKSSYLLPALGGFVMSFYTMYTTLPYLEKFRHHKEIGYIIKGKDPMKELKVYQVGYRYFEGIPFYAERRTEITLNTENLTYPSIVLIPSSRLKELKDCTPLWKGKIFDGSEAQFFKFLVSTKTGNHLKEYTLCFSR